MPEPPEPPPEPLAEYNFASWPCAFWVWLWLFCTCVWLGISSTVSLCVSDPPVAPTEREPLPIATLPPRLGRLNVVEPFPAPHAVPIAANSLGYAVRDTAEPSHSR